MAAGRPRYARVALDVLEQLVRSGVSVHAVLLYARLRLHRAKRSIPGLIAAGVAGLAESLSAPVPATRRHLRVLEGSRHVILDQENRLIYTTGAVQDDPPRTVQAVKAFARQLRELPAGSPVAAAVEREISLALASDRAYADLRKVWSEEMAETLSRFHTESQSGFQSTLQSESESTSLPVPAAPVPEIRDPQPPPDTAAEAYSRGWDRLPKPPFAAAAAEDITAAMRAIPLDTFGRLLDQLSGSKWISGQLHTPPTLRRLVGDRSYVDRIVAGEFTAVGARLRCPDCEGSHSLIDACPPRCRGCGQAHRTDVHCQWLASLEAREAREAELVARVQSLAGERGISELEAQRAIDAEDWRSRHRGSGVRA
jgi:hypothetical protein